MAAKAITWDNTYQHLGLVIGSVTLSGSTTDDTSEEFAAYDGSDASSGRPRKLSIIPDGAATQYTTLTLRVRSAADATNGITPATLAGQAVQPTISGTVASIRPGVFNLEALGYPALLLHITGGTGTQSQAVKLYLWT